MSTSINTIENEITSVSDNESDLNINDDEEEFQKDINNFAKDKLDTFVEYITSMYTNHPNEHGMTGIEHFIFAIRLSALTMISGLLMMLHALMPWWFTTTGGDLLIYASNVLKEARCDVSSGGTIKEE
jgi:hypothetical protein